MTTTFDNKANILADLWISYRTDTNFTDFIEYNDLGLPLAYAYANGLVELEDKAKSFIEEAFDLLLDGMNQEDTGFDTLDQLFSIEN
jgi:hypothetical protein